MSVASYCTRARIYPSRREHLTSAINSYCVWLTRPNQEVSDRHRVKVEHLSAGQFSIAHLIESEDRCVQAFPIRASTALSPEHDDLSVGGRYDAWLHLRGHANWAKYLLQMREAGFMTTAEEAIRELNR